MSNKFFKSFGAFEVKEVEGEARTFTGVASSSNPDRVQDVLVPNGAIYNLPMPLLFHHDLEEPIGLVVEAEVLEGQIRVKFTIPEVTEEGELKKVVDKAYQSLKYGLITGLSVGFIADWDSAEMREDGGFVFNSWEWYELSLVTVPCNRDSQIDKSFAEYTKKTCIQSEKVIKSPHKVVKIGLPKKVGVKI